MKARTKVRTCVSTGCNPLPPTSHPRFRKTVLSRTFALRRSNVDRREKSRRKVNPTLDSLLIAVENISHHLTLSIVEFQDENRFRDRKRRPRIDVDKVAGKAANPPRFLRHFDRRAVHQGYGGSCRKGNRACASNARLELITRTRPGESLRPPSVM